MQKKKLNFLLIVVLISQAINVSVIVDQKEKTVEQGKLKDQVKIGEKVKKVEQLEKTEKVDKLKKIKKVKSNCKLWRFVNQKWQCKINGKWVEWQWKDKGKKFKSWKKWSDKYLINKFGVSAASLALINPFGVLDLKKESRRIAKSLPRPKTRKFLNDNIPVLLNPSPIPPQFPQFRPQYIPNQIPYYNNHPYINYRFNRFY